MKRKPKLLPWNDLKEELLRDPKVRAEYDRLGPKYAVIRAILEARDERGFTQARLAKKLGTKQSAIARLESGTYNPSLQLLQKIADALDARLEITFTPKVKQR